MTGTAEADLARIAEGDAFARVRTEPGLPARAERGDSDLSND
jgi:hypothetical protein